MLILYLADGGEIAEASAIADLLRQRCGADRVRVRHRTEASLHTWGYEVFVELADDDPLQLIRLKGGALSIDGPSSVACDFVVAVYSTCLSGRNDVELCDDDGEFGVRITPEMDADTLAELFEDYQ